MSEIGRTLCFLLRKSFLLHLDEVMSQVAATLALMTLPTDSSETSFG
jgi:hypothetical protein